MSFAEQFINIFFSKYSLPTPFENDVEYGFKIIANDFLSPNSFPLDLLRFLQSRDTLRFTLTFGDSEPITYYTGSSETTFIQLTQHEYIYRPGDAIAVEFTIDKTKVNSRVSIYDLEAFTASIAILSISQVFAVFNRALGSDNILFFEVLNLEKSFSTASIIFVPLGFNESSNSVSRATVLESVHNLSYFTNLAEYKLIPDDFYIVVENAAFKRLTRLMNYLSEVMSVAFLFDITTLTQNKIDYKLNGYKTIQGSIELIPFQELDGYYRIYKWTFNGGNLNDKLGLARNILSLHISKADLRLEGDPFQSIQSSYKVYEKQNIKQYIEIRNKISDQLLEFNNRANKVIESFASGFQKSALALITFYVSAFAIKALGKGEFKNIFGLEASLLSIAIVSGAYIYYRVSKWEVLQQRRRFADSYHHMKERYQDLLDQNDINRILNNDKEYHSDIKFIDDKLKIYSRMWRSVLIILLLTTVVLYLINADESTLTKVICTPTC